MLSSAPTVESVTDGVGGVGPPDVEMTDCHPDVKVRAMAGTGINISAATRQAISCRHLFSRPRRMVFERMANSFPLNVEIRSVANPGALIPSAGGAIGTSTRTGVDYAEARFLCQMKKP